MRTENSDWITIGLPLVDGSYWLLKMTVDSGALLRNVSQRYPVQLRALLKYSENRKLAQRSQMQHRLVFCVLPKRHKMAFHPQRDTVRKIDVRHKYELKRVLNLVQM